MIELVKGNKVIKTPEVVTIELYQKIQSNPTCLENPIELISIFTGLSKDELKNQKKETMKLVNNFILSKLDIPQDSPLVLTFTHNGIEYGLEKDFGGMAWGAWVDLEVYSNTETINENLHKIMAILYRPIISKSKDGTKYEIEPYRSEGIAPRAELFLDLPIVLWFGASRFFLDIANEYITSIGTSLSQKKRMMELKLTGWKILPKWIQKMLPQDFILN